MDLRVVTDISLLRRYQRLDRDMSAESLGDELQRLMRIASPICRRGKQIAANVKRGLRHASFTYVWNRF